MHANDANAPPPPYRAHCGFEDAAGSSSVAAEAQDLIDLDEDTNNNPLVSPPSYEAAYDAGDAGRSRSEPQSQSLSEGSRSGAVYPPEKKAFEWGLFKASPGGSGSSPGGLNDCGHWAARGCSLTSGPQRCCSCLDRRDIRADGRYPVYIDGLGDRFGSTTRWAHYCSPCQEAERAIARRAGGVTGSEIQKPDAAELKRARREAARQAELQRLARAKAKSKNAGAQDREAQQKKAAQTQQQRYYEQNRAYHATHATQTTKHARREQHAQRMAEQEQAADERAAEARAEQQRQEEQKKADREADLVQLRAIRRQVAAQADALEVQLADKRAQLVRLDQQIWLNVQLHQTAAATTSTGPSSSDRAALAEKAALAETYGDHRRPATTAKAPLLSETTGGAVSSSSSSGGGGGWLGRVFGRGKGKEKERDLGHRPADAPPGGERYYGEAFFAEKRAEAEAIAEVKAYLREK